MHVRDPFSARDRRPQSVPARDDLSIRPVRDPSQLQSVRDRQQPVRDPTATINSRSSLFGGPFNPS
ncbi:hypothetical protein F2Q68_00044925 [Brassica cretica]|uniref:Uncharacterized protein n=1 Tax=Brassica cretica TaxID=69181 RepID=A0A8S9LKP2_BRACR|nr:hypothetical protein F2Q68_00044925 [Brassica cretica]